MFNLIVVGAGQEVGRSCILISIGGRNVMLDCGMHMGYNDERRFPDFSYITRHGKLDDYLHCVIISHFHLDHCGALPYMTEMVGYGGPIYMTCPTKAMVPVLLEDYRKVQVTYRGDANFFTSQMIKECMHKVIPVGLHESVKVRMTLLQARCYCSCGLGQSQLFTRSLADSSHQLILGDFNMTPDRHLGAAEIDCCQPDVLISETTYATTIRDSKRAREREFLKKVHECVERGGKVLIPVFALGRAQELCILLESYWERMNLKVPVYFSQGLAERATDYYKLFITWTSEKIKKTFIQRNMFEFRHISPFEPAFADQPGPMVLFATPGMLHSGQSLRMFKKWASDEKNMVIMPGYCVQGTIGHKVITGAKRLDIENGKTLEVKLSVEYMSFSAHADAKGIIQLIRNCQPRSVMFVHGEETKMEFLKRKVEKELELPVFKPENGHTVHVRTSPEIIVHTSCGFIKRTLRNQTDPSRSRWPFRGTLVIDQANQLMNVYPPNEAMDLLKLKEHQLRFTVNIVLKSSYTLQEALQALESAIKKYIFKWFVLINYRQHFRIQPNVQCQSDETTGCIVVNGNVSVKIGRDGGAVIDWNVQQDDVAYLILKCMKEMNL
ncbi:integrator complex subunit 11 [Trichuris trichiura]|uniref:Integrator complex subunit 11 n=1 Tax=Trichuris trichiura TaxID=36087 RepID=A0A077ZHA0_TRITR|nr:integrator complex subunit 11 [Trichuris trichiura]